ncbi:ferredoxin [Streptomyces sp. GMY02]|uniref:ferredoxin n=1 Tax=Streptomyces sp. GMY02 TaxID=1333528 RepID=UPI001C2C3302|nr:ferredoxin [Streptomyces sp. GMY02]QXE33321.1 ferredoxin [Streptomyces sp. GMY02]
MRTTLRVDRRECAGSGLCAAVAPELFRMTDGGFPSVLKSELSDADEMAEAEGVIACCPTEAISFVDTDTDTYTDNGHGC